MQITLSELYQFCMVIIGIIGLVIQAKKKQPPFSFQKHGDYFANLLGAEPFTGSTFLWFCYIALPASLSSAVCPDSSGLFCCPH